MRAKVAILSGVQYWALVYAIATVVLVLGKQQSWSAGQVALGSVAVLILIVAIGWRFVAALKPDRAVEAVALGNWWVLVFALLDYLAAKPFDSQLYEQLPYFVELLLVFITPLWWWRRQRQPEKEPKTEQPTEDAVV